ncbi:MAG: ABC transporter permease [Chloroflexaceae bacterium]|nr:ABC transporter permease [Chloroflexaceae bacterium]
MRQRWEGVRQCGWLARRTAAILRRDWLTLVLLLAQAPLSGLLIALLVAPGLLADGAAPTDAQRLIFMLVIAAVLLGVTGAARALSNERAIYRHERLIGLRVVPYVLAKAAVLLLVGLVQSGLLLLVVLPVVAPLPAGAVLPALLEWIIGLWLVVAGGCVLGLLISALADSNAQATALVPLVLVPQIVLAGLVFPLAGPAEWLSYTMVARWGIESLGTTADLNRLYYQSLGTAPPGITALPRATGSYNPAAYDSTTPRTAYTPASHTASRRWHLLGRWGILAGQAALLLALTCGVLWRWGDG